MEIQAKIIEDEYKIITAGQLASLLNAVDPKLPVSFFVGDSPKGLRGDFTQRRFLDVKRCAVFAGVGIFIGAEI